VIEPPGNRLNKERGDDVRDESIRAGVDGVRACAQPAWPMRTPPLLRNEVTQRRAHLPSKPGTSPAAQQRAIEPFVAGDTFEEGHPDLRWMLSPQVTDRAGEILTRLEAEGVKDFAG